MELCDLQTQVGAEQLVLTAQNISLRARVPIDDAQRALDKLAESEFPNLLVYFRVNGWVVSKDEQLSDATLTDSSSQQSSSLSLPCFDGFSQPSVPIREFHTVVVSRDKLESVKERFDEIHDCRVYSVLCRGVFVFQMVIIDIPPFESHSETVVCLKTTENPLSETALSQLHFDQSSELLSGVLEECLAKGDICELTRLDRIPSLLADVDRDKRVVLSPHFRKRLKSKCGIAASPSKPSSNLNAAAQKGNDTNSKSSKMQPKSLFDMFADDKPKITSKKKSGNSTAKSLKRKFGAMNLETKSSGVTGKGDPCSSSSASLESDTVDASASSALGSKTKRRKTEVVSGQSGSKKKNSNATSNSNSSSKNKKKKSSKLVAAASKSKKKASQKDVSDELGSIRYASESDESEDDVEMKRDDESEEEAEQLRRMRQTGICGGSKKKKRRNVFDSSDDEDCESDKDDRKEHGLGSSEKKKRSKREEAKLEKQRKKDALLNRRKERFFGGSSSSSSSPKRRTKRVQKSRTIFDKVTGEMVIENYSTDEEIADDPQSKGNDNENEDGKPTSKRSSPLSPSSSLKSTAIVKKAGKRSGAEVMRGSKGITSYFAMKTK